jgi:indolepyruvate decarboxylase
MMDGPFNDIPPWQYAEMAGVLACGKGFTVSTEQDLHAAMESAMNDTTVPAIIDVHIEKGDYSMRLRQLTAALKKRLK